VSRTTSQEHMFQATKHARKALEELERGMIEINQKYMDSEIHSVDYDAMSWDELGDLDAMQRMYDALAAVLTVSPYIGK